MNAVRNWENRSCHKNKEGEGDVAVEISKPKKLTGRGYKEWLRSRGKFKRSDPSIRKKRKQREVNLSEPNGYKEVQTANSDCSVSHSKPERLSFLLRRVKYSSNAEKSNTMSNAVSRTKQKQVISESRCNVEESKLHEKLAHSAADDRKSSTINFVEYWVPIRLSDVQMEQYCGSLFSNSGVLCSYLSHDALHEILISSRKCCDHPYLVDSSIRVNLVQSPPETEKLDAEIKLSSKLILLHKILQEIHKRGLRVLILYQILGGHFPITIGDILDDIIHEKFGEDSFVRIGEGISKSTQRAVLNTYNDKGCGRFVCLMETRACVSSIQLKSVDAVIFFNSDWDPMNDLKALQKINLDSQYENVKVFRLYSTCSVEEKLLMLAKQGSSLDTTLLNISRSTCHGLLSWGACCLFEKLDELHNLSTSCTHSKEDSFVEDVFGELSILLPNNEKSTVHTNSSSFILEAQQIGGFYPRNIALLGEIEYPLMSTFEMTVKDSPSDFWIHLFQGRKPRWKYISIQPPRTRRCVQRFDEISEAPKRCRTKAPTRSLNELQIQNITGAALRARQSPMPGNASPTQPCPLLSSQPLSATEPTHSESVCKILRTELESIQKQKTGFLKQREDMKLQAKITCQRELDVLQKKYEMALQHADMAFVEEMEALDTRYNKVFTSNSLAEAVLQREAIVDHPA